MSDHKLIVSPSPHVRGQDSTQRIMLDVLLALCPAVAASVVLFGVRALLVEVLCMATCVAAEYVTRRVLRRSNTIGDLSAAVTGLIFALNLPVTINPIFAMIGCVVAIVIVKQLFGGIGQNFLNPAGAARVVLLVSFPAAMSRWVAPFFYRTASLADAVTTATPLAQSTEEMPSYLQLFLGVHGGCMGETCALALLIGFVYLLVRRVISPVIPLTCMGTVAVFTLLLGDNPITALLSGGVMFAAIFMATDYTTSPITPAGRWVFGIGVGLITVFIRQFGVLDEGASYALVLMNVLVPHIERLTRPKAFGVVKTKGGKSA